MGLLSFLAAYIGEKILDAAWGRARPRLFNIIRLRKLSDKARVIAHALDGFSSHLIKPSKFTINTIGRIKRPEIHDISAAWEGGVDGILLVGEAGSGKSGIAHHLGRSLQIKGNPVLFLDATDVPNNVNPADYIVSLLPISTTLVEAFSILGKEQTSYFIIDQLDSIEDSSTLVGTTNLVKTLVSLPGVRVLAISRTYEANEDNQINKLDLVRVNSDLLSKKAAAHYLSELGIVTPSRFIAELAQNLLNLSLIAEILDAKGGFKGVTSETQLWERYTHTIKEREGEEVLRRGLNLACTSLRESREEIAVQFPPGRTIQRLVSRGILINSSFLRLRFRHERLQEFLCAYQLLPERPSAVNVYKEYGYLKGSRIVKWLHSLLHLHDKVGEARLVDELLSQSIEELPFYSRIVVLDNLREQDNPSKETSEIIAAQIANETYGKYFFTNLENPAWLIPLHENAALIDAPNPIEDPNNPGYFSMPGWYVGEYLKRMAIQFPEIVRDVALDFNTENPRAIRTLLEAIILIPPEIAAKTVYAFKGWSETPFVRFMMLSREMGNIMEYLTRGGQTEAALEVLEVLAEPIGEPDHINESKIVAATRFDFYWLNKSFQENLPALFETDPIGSLNVLEQQLIKAMELEHDPTIIEIEHRLDSYWRLNINPEGDLNYRKDFKNLLVNTIIFALDKACEQKIDEVPNVLEHYIYSEYSILRRIGVYTLRRWGGQYSDFLEKAYLRHMDEPIVAGQSEFQRLTDAQFGNLPENIQKEILDAIKDGPDPEWVEELLNQYPTQFEGDTKQEKMQSLVETWQLREYDRIASGLEGEEKELYERLLEKYDKPAPSPEVGVITSWVGPESPIGSDELSKKSVEEAIQFLVDFVPPEEDSFRASSREGLGRIFEEDVKARAYDYAENALLLIRGDLHYVFHTHYLRGLESAIKNQEKLALRDVIKLCEFLTGQEKDEFPKQEYEPGLSSAKLAVATILEQLLRNKEPNIDDELLDRIRCIIVDLLNKEDEGIDEEEDSSFDPATRSLNSFRGMAMHDIVMYGLYCERKRKKEQGEEGKPVMPPLVKDALTEKLDKSKYPSLAVHSVFGWYFPQLNYLDREWAQENRDLIFPLEPEKVKYWQAAWSAYIRFSDVYPDVFTELITHYQKALEELPDLDKGQSWERVDEKLATHILKAYVMGMISLDSKDELISMYYLKADPDTRSHGNFWLSQVLESQKPSAEDDVWQKIWDLWQWRLEEANSAQDKSDFTKEAASFCRLLKHVPLGLQEIYRVLEQTLEFKPEGFELHLIIEFLGRNCEQFPALATSLLHEMVLSGRDFYMTSDTRGQVKTILESAITADNKTKEKAVGIINFFGEQGDYKWRPLLEKLN